MVNDPVPVTLDVLTRHCRKRPDEMTEKEALVACIALRGLARWCLKPEVLAKAHRTDDSFPDYTSPHWPELPRDCGSCWVVFVQDGVKQLPALEPVFALPFQWRKGAHSQWLSEGVLREAESVRSTLGADGWGLHLHVGKGGMAVDLRQLDELFKSVGSGWAALAAGLNLATQQASPDTTVWMTGAWDMHDGIKSVNHLDQKTQYARSHGAKVMFVPEWDSWSIESDPSVMQATNRGFRIGKLKQGTIDLQKALGECTTLLDAKPPAPTLGDNSGFEVCASYYLRQPRGEERTTGFYWSHLYPTIVSRCRARLAKERSAEFRPNHLITVVSGSPELASLVAETLEVKNVLLLYTPNTDEDLDQTVAMEAARVWLKRRGMSCESGSFVDDESMRRELPSLIRKFVGKSDGNVVLDITPGTKLMGWVTDRAMPAGSWRVYLRHDTLSPKDRRPKPGTEHLICWRV